MAMALPLAVEAAAAAVAAVAAAAMAAVAGWAASVEAEVARAERTGACTPPAGGHWPYTRLVARRGNSHPRVGNGSHRLQCGKQCPCRRRRLSEVTTGRAQNRPGRCCADRRVCSGRVGWRRNRPSGGERPTRRRKPTGPSYYFCGLLQISWQNFTRNELAEAFILIRLFLAALTPEFLVKCALFRGVLPFWHKKRVAQCSRPLPKVKCCSRQ
jgi:hypothetical protein